MSGGVAIILLLIIVVVAAVLGIVLYLTGGALWASGRSSGDGADAGHRPEHRTATSPTTEHTEVVGAEEAAEDRSG